MLQQIRSNLARSVLGIPTDVCHNAFSRVYCLLGPQSKRENEGRTVKEAGSQGPNDG